jgi:hypothetical protein
LTALGCCAADSGKGDRAVEVTGVAVGAGLSTHAEWIRRAGDGDYSGHLRHIDCDVECGPTSGLREVNDASLSRAGDCVGGGDRYVEGVAAEVASGADAEALRIAFPSGAGRDARVLGLELEFELAFEFSFHLAQHVFHERIDGPSRHS